MLFITVGGYITHLYRCVTRLFNLLLLSFHDFLFRPDQFCYIYIVINCTLYCMPCVLQPDTGEIHQNNNAHCTNSRGNEMLGSRLTFLVYRIVPVYGGVVYSSAVGSDYDTRRLLYIYRMFPRPGKIVDRYNTQHKLQHHHNSRTRFSSC